MMNRTEKPTTQQQPSWRIFAHLFAFGLLLALAMMMVRGTPGAVELRKGLEQYIRNEILYREAIARNLDRADPIVRLTMVRKITMMGTAKAEAAELTEEEIQAYFALRKERYRIPATVNLMQVYLSKDKRGDRVQADAAQLLQSFKQREPGPRELADLGDLSMLGSVYTEMSEQDLGRTFGGEFGVAVLALTPGKWSGPIESGYGLHLVKVTHRTESRMPDLTEVGQRVIADMRYEGRKAAEDQLYAEIAPRYRVLYDKTARAVLEGGNR
jgi:hypothetical protein